MSDRKIVGEQITLTAAWIDENGDATSAPASAVLYIRRDHTQEIVAAISATTTATFTPTIDDNYTYEWVDTASGSGRRTNPTTFYVYPSITSSGTTPVAVATHYTKAETDALLDDYVTASDLGTTLEDYAAASDLAALTATVAGKAAAVHGHTASDITDFATAVDARVHLPPLALQFTSNGDIYFRAHEAMTLAASPQEAGTGTLAYAKALSATPTTFSTTTLPITLAAGDVLRVTCSSISSYKAATITRIA